jgi:adenylate cyclase
VDWEAEGLLQGLEGDARTARERLLDELHEDGVPLEDLRRAVEENRLVLLPVERVLSGDEQLTTREVAERSGLDLETLQRDWQALGLPRSDPDAPMLGEHDVEAAVRRKQFRDAGLPEEGLAEVARVMGTSMAQIAAAVRYLVGDAFLEAGASEREVAQRYAEAARQLNPLMGPMLEYAFQVHLREGLRQDVVDHASLEAGRLLPGGDTIAVGFADLVGFTRLGEQVPPDELGAVARRLADMAADVASAPVRLVKMIGDAAMLVSPDPDALIEASLALVQGADEQGEGFPQLRAGLACGTALQRAGDWYGPPVNVASRVTTVARPGSVLVTNDMRDWAKGEYDWSRAGARKFKGVREEVGLNRVRRQAA